MHLERHAWNRGFDWVSPSGPFQVLEPSMAAAFDRDGCITVPDLLTADEVAEITAEIDGFDAQTDELLRSLDGERLHIAEAGAITFTPHLVRRSDRCRRLTLHPRVLGVVADLCGPAVRLYWDQAVYKHPDKPRRFPWHQDNGYTFVEPQQYLTVWLALTDATEENGCPWVVPGLHRRGTLHHEMIEPLGWQCFEDHPDAEPVPVPAGGAAVFSSLTPHLTGPNTSDRVRKAYIVQYAPDGAEILDGDAAGERAPVRRPAVDPDRQYPVIVDGRPVAP